MFGASFACALKYAFSPSDMTAYGEMSSWITSQGLMPLHASLIIVQTYFASSSGRVATLATTPGTDGFRLLGFLPTAKADPTTGIFAFAAAAAHGIPEAPSRV